MSVCVEDSHLMFFMILLTSVQECWLDQGCDNQSRRDKIDKLSSTRGRRSALSLNLSNNPGSMGSLWGEMVAKEISHAWNGFLSNSPALYLDREKVGIEKSSIVREFMKIAPAAIYRMCQYRE